MNSFIDSQGSREDLEGIRRMTEVLANPLQMRLLVALVVESPLGVDALAERTGESLGRVRRDLNALVAGGMVSVAREESRRGTVKRYFAIEHRPWIGVAEDERLSDRDRRRHTVGGIRVIFDEATRAASNGRLGDRNDRLVANCPGRVDERGWRELSTLHEELLDRVQHVLEESRARLEAGGEKAIGVISEQILLEAPQHAPDSHS